jgi:3',5'-cyclic AMP phosphodiesterase CpdA
MRPRRCDALLLSRLVLVAALSVGAGCRSWHHVPTHQHWLEPAPALAPPPSGGHVGALRVAVYGDTRGNRTVHREVVAAISEQKPDLVIFTGDGIECLPVGHMPDYSGWQYAIPLWPQIDRNHPWALLASIVPFPALLHDTVGSLIARPRDPDGFNGFLEDTELLRRARAPLLFVPGNHDLYHRWDRQALARLEALSPGHLWYAVDIGDYRFIVLDTGTDLFGDGDAIPAGGEQIRWLDDVLGDAKRRNLRSVVAFHLPPFSSAREDGSVPWLRERLVTGVLDHHSVSLVLNGHAHAYERVERPDPSGRPVMYLITGGGGAPLFHEASERVAGSKIFIEGVRHFVMLELTRDEIIGRMIPVTGGRAGEPQDSFKVGNP